MAQRCPSPPMKTLISVGGQHQGDVTTPQRTLCSVLTEDRSQRPSLSNYPTEVFLRGQSGPDFCSRLQIMWLRSAAFPLLGSQIGLILQTVVLPRKRSRPSSLSH